MTDDTHAREAMAADLRHLVTEVEALHPEPTRGRDGRVALHAELERAVRDLPDEATTEAFYRRAAPLVSGLADAHSTLFPPEHGDERDRLPVSFRAVGDRLYVDAVPEDRADLLGAHLLAVGGVPLDTLADRVARFHGVENSSTALLRLSLAVRTPRPLARLLERDDPPAEATLRLSTPEGDREVAVPFGDPGRDLDATLEESVPAPEGTGPRVRRYAGDAALFVPGDLQGYRESLEAFVANDAGSAAGLAEAAYDRHVGGDPPDDLDATVAALPSMVGALTELADADPERVVVDLRDNPGGDSRFVSVLAYLLDGLAGVERIAGATRAAKRRTERHRERYGDPDDTVAEPAAYDLSDYLDATRGDRDALEARLRRSGTCADLLDDGSYAGALDPDRLVVAVSASTMSSGFAGAAQLTAFGADVVGVPSGQAPVSFGEPVGIELPNTGLAGRVGCALYHWVPEPDGRTLTPDAELTPERFEGYDRAADAGLRLAFDHAGVTDGEPPTPVADGG